MKKLLILSSSIFLILFLIGCNSPKNRIKKDLDSRFTKFEIVEVKEDSSNVYTAINILSSLELGASTTNLEIIKTLNEIESSSNKNEIYSNYLYIDSIYSALKESFERFENSRYDKPDRCYYVKYLLHKDELKITKEEYYHLRLMPNGKYDIIHRPYDWEEFLYERKYDLLIKKGLECSSYSFDLKWKLWMRGVDVF